MKLKRTVRYGMNFDGKFLTVSAFFAGLAFFLYVLYYYGLGRISAVSGADKVFGVVIPLVLLGVYLLLVKGVRLNIPLVYLCFTVLYCVDIAVLSFGHYPLWQDVCAVIWYVLCIAVLAVSMLGYFRGNWIAGLGFLTAAVARFFLRDFEGYFYSEDWLAAMPEAAILCGILALSFMSFGLKTMKK